MRDPINAELHRSRHDHARKFNFDLPAVCKDLEEQSRDLKLIRLHPNRISPKNRDNARKNP
jgi:hypothetical protein